MSYTNTAAYLDGPGKKLRIAPIDTHKPGKGEVLFEVQAVAINPVDAKQQEKGLMIQNWPYILGYDAAGVVVEVGEGVSHVSVGSRICVFTFCVEGHRRAGFQKYAIAPEIVAVPIPDDMSITDAAVIPLATLTAAGGLYMKNHLALPSPSNQPKKIGKTLLVWGGASSVGCLAIQLAAASGLDVFTTASPRNFELCKSLGASQVFDYNGESVVKDITAALKGSDFLGVYEASGKEDSMRKSGDILSALGGGIMAPVQPPVEGLPSNVKAEFVASMNHLVEEGGNAWHVWQTFLPEALKTGQVKPAPRAQVVGRGLEKLDDAMDTWRKGVSATKIVVEM